MGANAQTTVPTFTAGQVLTAAQMNNSARTGVPVFADTSARDAGFGGAGEKTLAEGQLCYLEDSNVVQYYDGSSWATVGPQSFSGGLVYIAGASFSAVSSVSFANDTFTSTYRNYKIILQISTVSVDVQTIQMRLRVAGSDITTSTYLGNTFGQNYSGTDGNSASSSATSFNLGIHRQTATDHSFDLYAPQVAEQTQWSGTAMANPANTQGPYVFAGRGGSNTTQADALTFFMSSGTLTGNYRVYGYADS